jgi:hypothetical protein
MRATKTGPTTAVSPYSLLRCKAGIQLAFALKIAVQLCEDFPVYG